MERAKRLSLKREALTELGHDDLTAVAGAAMTDACILTKICATVGDCITDRCTYTAICH